MQEPRCIAMFRRHVGRPVKIRRRRLLPISFDMLPHGLDEAGKFGRGHAAIMHGGEQCADLYGIGIALENDRQRIHCLVLGERTAVADAHCRGRDIFGKPVLRIGIVPDAGETVGNIFRCRLAFQKNAGAKGKRRRLHQYRLFPTAFIEGGRRLRSVLRIVDQVFGLRRQRTNAQPHILRKGGRAQALASTQKKLVSVSFPELLQNAAHRRCRQSHARRSPAYTAFPQQRIKSDK
ncbi:hypothetical protein D3C78_1076050 [compost metagenome]